MYGRRTPPMTMDYSIPSHDVDDISKGYETELLLSGDLDSEIESD